MLRSSDQIRIEILKTLRKSTISSYFQMTREVRTGFPTIKKNCEALKNYGLIKIEKIPKEKTKTKKESFRLSITKEGTRFLEKNITTVLHR